jgi:hypothetical protein
MCSIAINQHHTFPAISAACHELNSNQYHSAIEPQRNVIHMRFSYPFNVVIICTSFANASHRDSAPLISLDALDGNGEADPKYISVVVTL